MGRIFGLGLSGPSIVWCCLCSSEARVHLVGGMKYENEKLLYFKLFIKNYNKKLKITIIKIEIYFYRDFDSFLL